MTLATIRSSLLRAPVALLGILLRGVSSERLARVFYGLIRTLARRRPPADALRFILRLDNYLFDLAGQESVRYDGGLHTKHRHTGYHDFFCSRLARDERVLDLGSGNGSLAHDLATRAGARVTAIELTEANHQYATSHYAHERIRFIHGDARRDLPPESFDTIVLSNVLEHIEDRIGLLRDIQRRCRPRRWLIRVPVYERDWRVPLKDELGIDSRLDVTHCTEYREGELEKELEKAGLEITEKKLVWSEIWCEARPKHEIQ